MRLLLDTQLLLLAAGDPAKLSAEARQLIEDPDNQLLYSPVSLWEIALKHTLGRRDLRVDIRMLRRGMLDNGYLELPITGAHAIAMDSLPPLHSDPFDRMLVAQAGAEGAALLTADPLVAQYHGPVRMV
ncbi:MAG TPA: type II toxin-antitoxin system VapC family toxin [Acidobacteriaceae bacterium]|jgi:PIN domain nuclease of toxin-antitoxin system|nr:type II toxin-antitoxin system VapC family toxin [Acidobacteriaceae bacterium]